MRVKLAMMAATIACCLGVAGTTMLPSAASAVSVKPNLCEYECGGSWGAREHAKEFAKQHGLSSVKINGCELNYEYYAQWDCWGVGDRPSNQQYEWHVWIGEFGIEKHWTESYLGEG